MKKVFMSIIIICTCNLWGEEQNELDTISLMTPQQNTNLRIQSIQYDITKIKEYTMQQLRLIFKEKNMHVIQKPLSDACNKLFQNISLDKSSSSQINSLQLHTNLEQADQKKIIQALGDLTYSLYAYHVIVSKTSIFQPTLTLTINETPYTFSAHAWAQAIENAGFNKKGQFKKDVVSYTQTLLEPDSTFANINTALQYGGYTIHKAAELAWFFLPEQTYGIPQHLVDFHYHNAEPYRAIEDTHATASLYVDNIVHPLYKTLQDPYGTWLKTKAKIRESIKTIQRLLPWQQQEKKAATSQELTANSEKINPYEAA